MYTYQYRYMHKMLTSSKCGPSLSVIFTVLLFISQTAWSSAQTAPQLTTSSGESVSVTFEEEKGQVPLFSGGNTVSITDSDSDHLSEATLILVPGGDASMESLRLNTSALPQGIIPQSNYQSEQGLLSITGDYTLAEYESILSAVEYVSTNQNPDDTVQTRPIVTCRVQDTGTNVWSNNLTITITIVPFNDPPMIYLDGSSQLNNSLTFNFPPDPLQISTQFVIDDPDTLSVQSIQIVLELETTKGNPIDLSKESISSASPVLQEVNSTVYLSRASFAPLDHRNLPVVIAEVVYRNSDPSATINGTRVVRVTAVDDELMTNSGSSFPGMMSRPSFTFIRVGDEPPVLTTPADPITTTATEQQTPPITTTEQQTPPITTTEQQTPPITTTEQQTPPITTTERQTPLTCPEELNLPLISGSTLGLLVYNWTQTSAGEDHIGQPCPMVCQELAGFGTKLGKIQRRCDEREEAAVWSPVNTSECRLSITALQLCENSLNMASTEAAVMLTDVVVNITSQPEQLDFTVITVITTLVENLTQIAIQQPEVRENYLRIIDNILSADQNEILDGQVEANSSARLLESLRIFSENVPIGATTGNGSNNASTGLENFIVYALDNFGLILEDIDVDNFTGEAFSVDLGPVKEAIQSSGGIDEDSLIRMATALPNATTAVVVPKTLFDTDTHYQNVASRYNSTDSESVSLTNNTSVHTHRLIFSVFLQSGIFQNEKINCSKKAIGSVIASLQLNSSAYKLANASIKAFFQENRQACEGKEIPEEAVPVCSIFQVESNSIRYTSENCRLISSEGGVAKCECSQPGHFGLLFDLKPGEPLLPTLLQVASYVGACISILCLVLVIIIYLSSRDLRSTKRSHQGQLVINISFALLGLYVVFILSGHVTTVRPLCGLVAALLQYFILAYFAWTAVEAILLLFKIVLPLHKFGKYTVLKASIFAWLIPLFIVAISVGVGHNYYISDFYCRSFDKPFYFGTILPALLLYLFNWIIFLIILFSFIHKHLRMSAKGADSAHTSNRKKFKTYFTIIVALSFFFGLGWGFGLAATSSEIRELTFVFQLLFCIFVGSQGILVFILHCIKPQHMRKKWKSWYKIVVKHIPGQSSCFRHCQCCKLRLSTDMHTKSPAESSNNNGFSAHYNNCHKLVQHHNLTPAIISYNVLENNNTMDTAVQNGQSSAAMYELIQSAPYRIEMTSDSSKKSFDNPAYVSISPPEGRARTQTLPQASVTHITDRASKRKVCPLESIPSTEIIDLDD